MPRLPRSLVSAFSSLRAPSTHALRAQPPAIRPSTSLSAPSLSLRAYLHPSIIPHPLHPRPSPLLSLLSLSLSLSPTQTQSLFPTHQVRHIKRGTEYQPSQRKRKRKHGFLARRRSVGGRKILVRRRTKGRRYLSH